MGAEIVGYRIGQQGQQLVHQFRAVIGHGLDAGEIPGGTAFHHVGGQGPGAAGKADKRHLSVQLAAYGAHRRHDIAQVVLRRDRIEPGEVRLAAHGLAKLRPLALFEVQAQAQGIGHREDIGEQYGGVHGIAAQRLQGHFTGQFIILAQVQERPGLFARGPVFRQVAPRLAHHPYRCAVHWLAQQGAQETIIFQFSHEL